MTEHNEHNEHDDLHPSFTAAARTARFAQDRLLAHGHDPEQASWGLLAGAVAAFIKQHGEAALPEAIARLRKWTVDIEVMTEDTGSIDGVTH